MESLAEQPTHEKLRSFDPLASVDMMRFDLQRFGQILPETRQRVGDEELSYIAEGIDRASCTTFRLSRDENGELVYFNEASWRPYTSMLLTGMEVAEAEAQLDPRRQFLAEWATRDWQIGMQLSSLKPGESMSWHNGYPHDIEERYGAKFMQDRGLKPRRKMGFLYHASCQEDGSVVLQSQTIDRSDPNALAAVDAMLDYDSAADIDTMLRTYDGHLVKEFGGNFYAGRLEAEIDENVWREIVKNRPLIEYFLDGIEEIAARDIPRDQLEYEAKKHTYGVWAALKDRLMNHAPRDTYNVNVSDVGPQFNPYQQSLIEQEVQRAYQVAASRGDVLVGCGGAIPASGANDNLSGLSGEDAFDSIFGKKPSGSASPESYKFDKKMYCVVCQAPPTESERKTEAKKLCGPCGICKGCDSKIQAKAKTKS